MVFEDCDSPFDVDDEEEVKADLHRKYGFTEEERQENFCN